MLSFFILGLDTYLQVCQSYQKYLTINFILIHKYRILASFERKKYNR